MPCQIFPGGLGFELLEQAFQGPFKVRRTETGDLAIIGLNQASDRYGQSQQSTAQNSTPHSGDVFQSIRQR